MTDLLTVEPRLRSDQVREEAGRCLQCFDAPCTAACPAGIVIPRFIRMLRSGNVRGAAEVVRASNPLALSCGVACPDDHLCGAVCVRASIDRPVEIRRLHRFATEIGEGKGWRSAAGSARRPARRARRVVVIGAGPAGLACAHELRRAGVAVTLLEARAEVGGVLSRTIPLYRFPGDCVRRDAAWALGRKGEVELRLGSRVLEPAALARSFDAVFLAVGLRDAPPRWEGAGLRGVVPAEEFLARTRAARYRNRIGSEVAVIGGGNVAIDAALAAVRCGQVRGGGHRPRVHLLYRRTRREMPAWEREIALAEAAGVLLHPLVLPERFVGSRGRLTGIELSRARLVNRPREARPRPEPLPGSRFFFRCDQAILATGQRVDAALLRHLPRTQEGYLRAHASTRRVKDRIFAGGDAAGSEQKIVSAVRDGRRGARAILAFLEGGRR